MDPKRKRIYLIVIVASIIATGVILIWGRSQTPSLSVPNTSPTPAPTSFSKPVTPSTRGNSETVYLPPAVFPQNTNFDTGFLESSSFKQLQQYQAITNDQTQLGRDDPFKSY